MVGVSAMSVMLIAYRVVPVHGPDAAWTLGQSALGLGAAIAMAWAFAPSRRRPASVAAARSSNAA